MNRTSKFTASLSTSHKVGHIHTNAVVRRYKSKCIKLDGKYIFENTLEVNYVEILFFKLKKTKHLVLKY